MARKTPIRTNADLTVFLRNRRKKLTRRVEIASRSTLSIKSACQRFAAVIAPKAGVHSPALLRKIPNLDILIIEEFDRIRSSRREHSQKQNAQRSSKTVYAIGPQIPHNNGPHAVARRLPRTVLGFADDFLRTRLRQGPAPMKFLWRELFKEFQSIDPSAQFCGGEAKAEFISLMIEGQRERLSWSAFERVQRAARSPAATLGELAKL